jgi:hypothetical protein
MCCGARRGLLLGALMSTAMPWRRAWAGDTGMATDAAALVERARQSGSVAVIVGFGLPDTETGSEAAIAAARGALYLALGIADGADGALVGPGIERVRPYTTIPFVAMTVDAAALERIMAQPMVTSISEDVTAEPQP